MFGVESGIFGLPERRQLRLDHTRVPRILAHSGSKRGARGIDIGHSALPGAVVSVADRATGENGVLA